MRRILLLGLLAVSSAAVGCNVLCGRCDCTYDAHAADQPAAGPSYPVINHGAPTPATAPAPMPNVPPMPPANAEKAPDAPKSSDPMKDLPKLPTLPEKSN